MARYDSPGYQDQVPGLPPRNSHDYGTAPGTVGIDPAATDGPVVGTPVVSVPFASSQPAEGRPRLSVTSGDTSAFSDDQPVHDGTAFMAGGDTPVGPAETGAGRGHVVTTPHPNSAGLGSGYVREVGPTR
jgi:hypothetical protein